MNSSIGLLPGAPAARAAPRADQPTPTARRWLVVHWSRVALVALLVLTAVAYIWDLSVSGNANSFYAAAVQAGTKSWKAFFFGSVDSSNFITVDKPPASLWVMSLSGRIFGFSTWSMLLPQVLEGVASVALLYASVKRSFGSATGLAAGALLALTPVSALMFRYNNPDALLVLLLIAGAYCMTRAWEGASTRWVIAAGTMIGLAFLAKMMQAFLVLPAFALVYLVIAPTGLRRRVLQTLAGGVAIVVSAGWWVAIVALWPAASRPAIDGSTNNSIINLIVGYNGLGRIFGDTGPGGSGGGSAASTGGGGGPNFGGSAGLLRMFNSQMGGQASWLLPAALLALVAGLWITRRAPRTDRTRAAFALWGGWLVVTDLVFSLSSGIIHTYYTVALAPAIAALVAMGGRMLWEHRTSRMAAALTAVTVAITTGWAWELLDRTPHWQPWLRAVILAAGIGAIVALAVTALRPRLAARVTVAGVTLGVIAGLAGPLAYAANTITTKHTAGVPMAGPMKLQGFSGASAPSTALKVALESDASRYRWIAATSGSMSAAPLELATGGDPVMAIGGFNGGGGNLTLAQFKAYVTKGEIHYYVASSDTAGPPGGGEFGDFSGGGPPPGAPGGGGGSSAITNWVNAHFKSTKIGGVTVSDLTSPK